MVVKVRGQKEILRNLNREIKLIGRDSRRGIAVGLLSIKKDAQDMAPVDEAVLKNSAFTSTSISPSGKVSGRVGFTARYAAWVHEMPGTLKGQPRRGGKGRYWDPQGKAQPKFLSKAVIAGLDNVLTQIRRFAKR